MLWSSRPAFLILCSARAATPTTFDFPRHANAGHSSTPLVLAPHRPCSLACLLRGGGLHRTLLSLARRARAFRDTSLPSSCSSTALTTPAPHVARLNNAARFAPDVFAPSFPLTSLCTALAPGRGAPSRVAAIWRETLKPKQITPTPLPPPARRSTCCLRIRLATTTSKSQARSSHHTPRATRLPQGQGTSTSRPKYLEGSSCYHAPNQRVEVRTCTHPFLLHHARCR